MNNRCCHGIVITVTRRRFHQLLYQFMRKDRYPHRIVPHRFRSLPRNICNGTPIYIISESFLRGICYISMSNRETNLTYLENWVQITPPLRIRGFGGFRGHDFRYCTYFLRLRNIIVVEQDNILPEYISNEPIIPICLQGLRN